MNPDLDLLFNRRKFLNRFGMGLGGIALADLLKSSAVAAAFTRTGGAPARRPR